MSRKEEGRSTAVVTGGASGIGLAIAREAGARGMSVVLVDVDETGLGALVDEVDAARCDYIVCDVTSYDEVEKLTAKVNKRYGQVRLLVNSAGAVSRHDIAKPFWQVPLGELERLIKVNMLGTMYCCRAFLPLMLASEGSGQIVNIASALGLFAEAGKTGYTTSKYGVVGLSESIGRTLDSRDKDVGVSVVCPGFVQTSLVKAELERDPYREEMLLTSEEKQAVQRDANQLSDGMSPRSIAKLIFQGIERGDSVIGTHETTAAMVRRRYRKLLRTLSSK